MTPVVKIINSNRIFKVLSEEMLAEYGNLCYTQKSDG